MVGRLFPILVAICETGAGLVYLAQRNYRLAIIWLAYGIAAWALVGLK